MLDHHSKELISDSREDGWVLEPDAKSILKAQGLVVPKSIVTSSRKMANEFLASCPGAVVIKAVSPKILHKTEYKAVVTGITEPVRLEKEMSRLLTLDGCSRVLIEEMVQGIEVIVGAKNDYQFGPVIVFGVGGTSVEIYNDTAIRLAPLRTGDVRSMVNTLKAKDILWGHRGEKGIHMSRLSTLLVKFSNLVMALEQDFESIDLNPVICTADECIIADARIILN